MGGAHIAARVRRGPHWSHVHAETGRLGSPACCAEVPTVVSGLPFFGSRLARFCVLSFSHQCFAMHNLVNHILFCYFSDQPEPDPTELGCSLLAALGALAARQMEIATTQLGGRATAAGPFKGRAEVRTIPG